MTKPNASSLGLTVADLFSGAGGLSAGFRAAGFEPIFALDKDEDSCITYEKNFRVTPQNASIADFTPEELAKKLGAVDVILGGLSCQTFSPKADGSPGRTPRTSEPGCGVTCLQS